MEQQKPLTVVKSEPLTVVSSQPLGDQPQPSSPGLFERFFGWLGVEPSEQAKQYRGILDSGGSIEDVLNRASDDEKAARGGGVLRESDRSLMPAVGGAIGGALGGVPGAALGGAAGEAVRQLDNRAAGRQAPQSMGQAAAGIATQGALQGAATGAGNLVSSGLAKAAPRLMQSAVKPTASLLKEFKATAPGLAHTLLRQGVNVSDNGLLKLQKLLTATNDEISAVVNEATGSVSKRSVAARALTTADKVSKQTNPTADLKVVGETVEEFVNHPVFKGPKLSVQEAQAMKVGTYQQIGKKYGEISNAGVETQKALARGLKEEIAAEVPNIARLNAREAELLMSAEAVGRRIALAGNRDPVGFAWVASHPATFLTALMDRSPKVKSMLARGLYKGAAVAGRVSEQSIRLAVHALASGTPAPVSGLQDR